MQQKYVMLEGNFIGSQLLIQNTSWAKAAAIATWPATSCPGRIICTFRSYLGPYSGLAFVRTVFTVFFYFNTLFLASVGVDVVVIVVTTP